MSKSKKRIMLVGGGTGGHVVPVFEVYKRLMELDSGLEIVVVGSGTEIEKRFFENIPGYRIMPTGKLRRHWTLKNIKELFLALMGFGQAFFLLAFCRPHVIFSKGGYVALPIIFWAKSFRIPYVIHESDTAIGIGNKIGVSAAKKIFVAFPREYYPSLPKDKTVYSAPITRRSTYLNIEETKREFGFENSNPIIFVTGGSQGAAHINENVEKILVNLLPNYNIIHQCGDYSFLQMKQVREALPEELRSRYHLTNFLKIEGERDKMLEAISVANLVIARAGATTIFELVAQAKPMILAPWKHASSDHQTRNAQIVAEKNGAIVIADDDLSPELLLKKITECFDNGGAKMVEMSSSIQQLFPSDGLEKVCQTLLEIIRISDKNDEEV